MDCGWSTAVTSTFSRQDRADNSTQAGFIYLLVTDQGCHDNYLGSGNVKPEEQRQPATIETEQCSSPDEDVQAANCCTVSTPDCWLNSVTNMLYVTCDKTEVTLQTN